MAQSRQVSEAAFASWYGVIRVGVSAAKGSVDIALAFSSSTSVCPGRVDEGAAEGEIEEDGDDGDDGDAAEAADEQETQRSVDDCYA